MGAVDEIISNIPMSQLAQQLGVDEQTAEEATRQAIPALLGGLQANAQDESGAASLANALGQHSGDLFNGGVSLDQVDVQDGDKIVGHIFGSNQDQVVQTLASNGSAAKGLIQKLLPILAPIVLAYIANQVKDSKYGDLLGPLINGAAGASATGGGGALGDLLGDLLAGGGAAPQAPAGAAAGSPAGSIIDLLGGLLGGGRR